MFWKPKGKTKNSQTPASTSQQGAPQPRFMIRRPPPTYPPHPPPAVEYVPPTPPPPEEEEDGLATSLLETEAVQAEPPLPPSAEEIADMRQRGVTMVTSGKVDEGVSLLLDVLDLVPDDLEAKVWIALVRSDGGEAHLSPANRQRLEQRKAPQVVKPQIIVRR